MEKAVPTSGKAMVAFAAGLLSVLCGIIALVGSSDLFLAGVPLFWLLALVLGVWGLAGIRRAAGGLGGSGLACGGIGLPVAGFTLGFLLLPAT
jgi:hypothetical protein